MSHSILIKQKSILKQLEALSCEKYRITLKPRREELKPQNFGNASAEIRKKTNAEEKFWTKQGLTSEKIISRLTVENMRGYDIYITPISLDFHYFVIDDTTIETLQALKDAGYKPCLTQRSSLNNIQAILIVNKKTGKDEQSFANTLVVKINKEFGDKKFCGVIHPFRLSGFFNKKEGRNNAETVVLTTENAKICEKASAELESIRVATSCPSAFAAQRAAVGGYLVLNAVETNSRSDINSLANENFLRFWKEVERKVDAENWTRDLDKFDYKIARSMNAIGFDEQAITTAILSCSKHLSKRHKHTHRYAQSVARNAVIARALR